MWTMELSREHLNPVSRIPRVICAKLSRNKVDIAHIIGLAVYLPTCR